MSARIIDFDPFVTGAYIGRFHKTMKPVNVYKRILQLIPPLDGPVIDPNMGSGTSRLACYDMGIDYYGCEIDKDYFDQQEIQFINHIAQQDLFKEIKPKQTAMNTGLFD